MKLLKQIKTKYFVSLDIETVRYTEHFEDLSEEWQSAWEYKNKQDGEIPDQEVLSNLWSKKASLYAEFSKICAVSLAFLDKSGESLLCKEFYGEDELQLLTDLGLFLDRIASGDKNFRLVGHAAKYFDYPFLSKRYIITGLDIPLILDTAHLKPWENTNLCTNQDIWKMGGTGSGSSLQALCTVLGIPVSKVDLVGDEVGAVYFEGDFERIGRYCSYDTIATFNIIRRIKKEPIFQFEEVKFLDEVKEEAALPEPLPILERIYTSKEVNDTDRKELKVLIKKKKLAKKDIPVVKDIITRLYVNSEMFKADKAAIVQSKEEEINNLIEEICQK